MFIAVVGSFPSFVSFKVSIHGEMFPRLIFFALPPDAIKKLQKSSNCSAIDFLRETYRILTGNYFEDEDYSESIYSPLNKLFNRITFPYPVSLKFQNNSTTATRG